ncbi:MAG: phosphoribosylglycinamide formyltransferase [Anaerolineales bacterium]
MNEPSEFPPFRLVVLASGNGTNLQAILDACDNGTLPAEVVAVISDRKNAYALQRAIERGIPALYRPWGPYQKAGKLRTTYDLDLAVLVSLYEPDLIILAGWMRLLTMSFLEHFPEMVINLHPALPGAFPGTDAIARAFHAFQRGEISHTGVMVHFVPDEGVDEGPVIATEIVPIFPDDTLETLEVRVHETEHRVLVEAIGKVLEEFSEEE